VTDGYISVCMCVCVLRLTCANQSALLDTQYDADAWWKTSNGTCSLHIYTSFIRQKMAANTNVTKEKAEHVQITTIHGFR